MIIFWRARLSFLKKIQILKNERSLKNIDIFYISKRYNEVMNVILGIMEKMHRLALRTIVSIQFYNKYFYSETLIEQVLLRLRKRILSMTYVCDVHLIFF